MNSSNATPKSGAKARTGEGRLEPSQPARQVPPRGTQIPRQPGGSGWQRAEGSPLHSSRLPGVGDARLLTPALPRRRLASAGTFTAPRRGGKRTQVLAAGRRHRKGQVRRADPGSECPALAGTPRRPGCASDPTRPARLLSGSQSPLKHLLWRLETEFEHPPISGGRRAGPGQ